MLNNTHFINHESIKQHNKLTHALPPQCTIQHQQFACMHQAMLEHHSYKELNFITKKFWDFRYFLIEGLLNTYSIGIHGQIYVIKYNFSLRLGFNFSLRDKIYFIILYDGDTLIPVQNRRQFITYKRW